MLQRNLKIKNSLIDSYYKISIRNFWKIAFARNFWCFFRVHPTHGRRHQKSKTGVALGPQKGLVSSNNHWWFCFRIKWLCLNLLYLQSCIQYCWLIVCLFKTPGSYGRSVPVHPQANEISSDCDSETIPEDSCHNLDPGYLTHNPGWYIWWVDN